MPDHSDSLLDLHGSSNRPFRLRLGRYAAAAEQIDAFVGDRPGCALGATSAGCRSARARSTS